MSSSRNDPDSRTTSCDWKNGSATLSDDAYEDPDLPGSGVLINREWVKQVAGPDGTTYWEINGAILDRDFGSSASNALGPESQFYGAVSEAPPEDEAISTDLSGYKKFSYCSLESYAEYLDMAAPERWGLRGETQSEILIRFKTRMDEYADHFGLGPYEEWARNKAGKTESEGTICGKCLIEHKHFFVKYELGKKKAICPCTRSSAVSIRMVWNGVVYEKFFD